MGKCLFCNAEVPKGTKKCPNCGRKYISKNTLIILIVIGAIIVIPTLVGYANGSADESNSNTNTNNSTNNTNIEKVEKEDLSSVQKVYELSDGYYTAGVDLPVGKCNLTVISGSGNVSSSNIYSGGINAMMGISDSGYYSTEFKGLKMDKKVVLSISNGVKIKIEYTNITGNYTGRTYDESNSVELGDGNYTIGDDIKAGIYNITAISGSGNVSSSNIYDGGINAMMSVNNEEYYSTEYKNVTLKESGTLSISNGVRIKLVPTK